MVGRREAAVRPWILCCVVVVVLFGWATVGEGTICAYDAVPASTLVFPFVEFDYPGSNGQKTTIIGITNTSHESQIVHVTLWTDTGEPILDFNIVLSGYDVQLINIRDILQDGILPLTGTAGNLVVSGFVSPGGPVTPIFLPQQPQSTAQVFDRCNDDSHPGYPGNYDQPIPSAILDLFKSWLQRSQTETRLHRDCAGGTYSAGDWFETRTEADTTWMWLTADVIWTCTRHFPDYQHYWEDGPTTNPTFDEDGGQRYVANALMGDVMWFDLAEGTQTAGSAIHLEASPSLGDTSVNSPVLNPTTGMPQSFYHTLSSPWGSSDLREPLPSAWAFRYMAGTIFETNIRVFKAPSMTPDHEFPGIGVEGDFLADDCLAYTYYAWDEDENVTEGGAEPNLLPLFTQEIDINNFLLPDDSGWILMQWPWSNVDYADLYQTWVEVEGGLSQFAGTVRPALAVGNTSCDHGETFVSGFELSNTGAWTLTEQ